MTHRTASRLVIGCRKHRRYTGERKSNQYCDSCRLLYVLRHQWARDGERRLGSLNAYAYLIGDVDLEEACSGIKVKKMHFTAKASL